jgi:hypothetical protein
MEMKINFDLLKKMIAAGASGQMVLDAVEEQLGESDSTQTGAAFSQPDSLPVRDNEQIGADAYREALRRGYVEESCAPPGPKGWGSFI